MRLRVATFNCENLLSRAKILNFDGVIEVEDRLTLEKFGVRSLKGIFPFNMVIDGNDARGIDVGLLTKHEFGRIKTHVFDTPASGKRRIFSRDCLEAEVLLPGGKSLFLVVNHFKSQGYGSKVSNDARRKAQADRVRHQRLERRVGPRRGVGRIPGVDLLRVASTHAPIPSST